MKFISLFVLILFLSTSLPVKSNGLAIEPTLVIVANNAVSNVVYYNETNEDYILYSRVVTDGGVNEECSEIPFLVNPPIRMIKNNSQANLGVIYLKNKKECELDKFYFLSVSAIPKANSGQMGTTNVPIVLTQNIPIVFNLKLLRDESK
ncbi:fimbria/pilus periplasmic chaperone [Escherichia coli]|uniref:fimbria/pilus periplasmic chaperone n=1 Tax=Escherichia coli TaxID=562 RepID=UPI00185ACAC4|nr:fimbria/pilus periplasmic chaperone [Escherichia coli]EFH1069739.1 molecular chaperone [Escherichia coli]ELC3205257.1 molecular chaperone [Escherichia coli]